MKTLFTILATICLGFYANVLQSQQVEINIISVNDTHSNLTPGGARDSELKGTIGGMARATSVIGEAMQNDTNTLLLHAGDFFIGDLWFYLNYGVLEIEWMKMMGFDAITLGNHEFDGTVDMITGVLAMGLAENEIPVLSANLEAKTEKGELLAGMVVPHIIKEINGIKVGIFGMTSPVANMTSLSLPDVYVMDEDAETTIMIAGGQVQALKEQGCDVIIFLSHLGFQFDSAIASNIPMIDLIIGAHDHFSFEEAVVIGNTSIIQSGAFFQQMGKTKLTLVDKQITKVDYQLVNLDSNIPEEPIVSGLLSAQIDSQDEQIKALFTLPIAICEEDIIEHTSDIFSDGEKSTGVGNIVSNAFKSFGKTDIGFTTGGLTAQKLYKGPIVGQDVVRMLGYELNETSGIGYNMVTFNIKGSELKKGIEICLGAMASFQDDEFLPQLAGIELDFNLKLERYSVKMNGIEISNDDSFSLTTTVFVSEVLRTSGIEFSDFILYPEVTDFGVVLEYIMSVQKLNNEFLNTVAVGVKEIIENSNFKQNSLAFPNPANDNVNINLNTIKSGNYEVKAINSSSLEIIDFGNFYIDEYESQITLDVANLINGKYLVIIKGANTYFSSFTVCR